ncbi:recombinase family protein [Haloarcula hispanica]|uniref:Recombinase family protein n=1 Tax=Haloarcula hispanica TaxID=51589 RepID=A0A482TH88_HALHI|nr:recombinase family protein [Haloarcula hispanica]MCJ0620101.1 recombinase family protein [Haloarcula hispanica]RYJ10533.1 recombinase family protein [Haloarcula hispanica]
MGDIGCYCRVSTQDQSLDRQLESTQEYAEGKFDADLGRLRFYRDKSTGTNTERADYQQMMADAESGDIDAVVVHSISRICRSISDLERTASQLEDAGVELHIISEGLTLRPDESDPYQTALFQLLGVFAELEANMAQQRTKEGIAARQQNDDYHHGPAPLGFEKNDGLLVEGENYHEVVGVLDMVQKNELSKRKAAQRLNTSRATVNRALDRASLYGI